MNHKAPSIHYSMQYLNKYYIVKRAEKVPNNVVYVNFKNKKRM